MDFLFPDRQRFERVMILLSFVAEPFRPTSGPERVGKLGDGKDAFVPEFLAFLQVHSGQQAEFVFLNRNFPATCLKFTLGTVPVQNKVGRRRTGKQRDDLLDAVPDNTSLVLS